jgi:hypothetical protein
MSSNAISDGPINNYSSEVKSKPSHLPLGWTQVKRKRTAEVSGESSDVVDWCCDDPSCPRPSQHPKLSLKESQESSGDTPTTIRGHAIFCMSDIDPTWVQGYFLVDGIKKPWGLLAVTEELDECLQCVDGGYRRVTLTVFPFPRKKVSYTVDWTGGDMMRLEGESVSMEPDRMLTGTKALPYVRKYFMNIIQKLRDQQRNDNDGIEQQSGDILDMLPNIAVVMGPMKVELAEPCN